MSQYPESGYRTGGLSAPGQSAPGAYGSQPGGTGQFAVADAEARRRAAEEEDVNAFPGHIACDAASASELVVPIVRDGRLIAVLDLDSPTPARFTEEDEAGCVAVGELLARVL